MSLIEITAEAAEEVRVLAKRARAVRYSEISGLGLAKQVTPTLAVVYKVWPLLHESYGGAHVELSADIVNKETARLFVLQRDARAAKDADQPYDPNHLNIYDHLRVWWHTHPSGLANYSGTDVETINTLSYVKGDWMVGLLTDGNFIKTRLQQYKPWSIYMELADTPLHEDPEVKKHRVAVEAAQKKAMEEAAREAKKAEEEAERLKWLHIDKLVAECLPPKPGSAGLSFRRGHYDHKERKWVDTPGEEWEAEKGFGLGRRSFYGEDWRSRQRYTPSTDSASPKVTGQPLLPVWDNRCNHKKCEKPPVLITDFGSQYCQSCVGKVGVPKKMWVVERTVAEAKAHRQVLFPAAPVADSNKDESEENVTGLLPGGML